MQQITLEKELWERLFFMRVFIFNKDKIYIIKIIKSLEDSGVLNDGAAKTVKHEIKKNNNKADFLGLC